MYSHFIAQLFILTFCDKLLTLVDIIKDTSVSYFVKITEKSYTNPRHNLIKIDKIVYIWG